MVFETFDHLRRAAVVRPRRKERGETIAPGGVGVGVGGDVGPGGARGVDFRDDLGHASPVAFAGDLNVPDFDGNARFAADAQGLIDRFEHGVALVAHVRGVDAAEFAALGGEGD